jgi:hypothetical protein
MVGIRAPAPGARPQGARAGMAGARAAETAERWRLAPRLTYRSSTVMLAPSSPRRTLTEQPPLARLRTFSPASDDYQRMRWLRQRLLRCKPATECRRTGVSYVAMIFRAPSVDETSFNCPHCGALAHQTWYEAGARQLDKDTTPSPWTRDAVEAHLAEMAEKHPATMIESAKEVLGRLASGFVSIYKSDTHFSNAINNIWLTEC